MDDYNFREPRPLGSGLPQLRSQTSSFKVLFSVLKGHVCQPRVGAKRKPWVIMGSCFQPRRGWSYAGAPEDLPFQGRCLGASFTQGFRFAPTLG